MMRHFRQLTLFLSLSVAAAAQWHCGSEAARKPDPATVADPELEVNAVQVQAEEWTVAIPISGSLRSKSIVEIKAEVGGRLTAIHFEEGDLVRKDQLLAEIDTTNYELAAEQAKAALAVAEAGLGRATVALEHAEREKQRADNLLRTGGITEKDHQAAATAVKEAEAQVRLSEAQCGQARAAVSVADKALKDCRVLSPAEGHVQRKFYDRGSLVAPGSPLYSLVDNSRLELECYLQASRLSEIRIGRRATFTTPTFGERRFQGTVSAVNPMVESDNRSVKVDVQVSNPGGELLTGMFARGEIEVRKQPGAAVIPRSALIAETGESAAGNVYVVDGGKARLRAVRLGGAQQDRIWVQDGLRQGEWVIAEIGPNLKDGSSVAVGIRQ